MADPLRSSGFRCVHGVLLCGRGSPTHPNPLDRQVFDMGSNERDECMNEIRLLQSMHHPHIIDYLSCVIEHNELTVVMELVPASCPSHPSHRRRCRRRHCRRVLTPIPSPVPRRRLRTATWLD